MSEVVHYKGKLTQVPVDITNDETFKDLCIKEGYINDCYDSWEECLLEEGCEKYLIVGDKLFVAEYESIDLDDEIIQATDNKDGSYTFEVKYYNGGCSFSEAIEEALDKLKDTV
jgi:hypothetical protein